MRKYSWLFMLAVALIVLSACGGKKDTTNDELDGLLSLDVEFEVPETADVDEKILFKALVTYGDETVEDANEVNFEYWEEGNEDDSTTIESINNGDGTYTAEVAFDADGIYSMYAHVTARGIHTMPKKSVIVGEGTPYEAEHDDGEAHGHEHTEGFGMQFMEPEYVVSDQEIDLIVNLNMDDEHFENANVRYEIWNDDISDKHDWVDVEELTAGEYSAAHTFKESGTYSVQIHVEDDEGLHEHEEYEIVVSE